MMLQTKSLLLIALLSTTLIGCGAKKSEQDQAEAKKKWAQAYPGDDHPR